MVFFRFNHLYIVGWEPMPFLSAVITLPPTIFYPVHIGNDGMLAE
jgi:hypothetical protein